MKVSHNTSTVWGLTTRDQQIQTSAFISCYNDLNRTTDSEITIYSILRSFQCPKYQKATSKKSFITAESLMISRVSSVLNTAERLILLATNHWNSQEAEGTARLVSLNTTIVFAR